MNKHMIIVGVILLLSMASAFGSSDVLDEILVFREESEDGLLSSLVNVQGKLTENELRDLVKAVEILRTHCSEAAMPCTTRDDRWALLRNEVVNRTPRDIILMAAAIQFVVAEPKRAREASPSPLITDEQYQQIGAMVTGLARGEGLYFLREYGRKANPKDVRAKR